jgi:hypothetical protein
MVTFCNLKYTPDGDTPRLRRSERLTSDSGPKIADTKPPRKKRKRATSVAGATFEEINGRLVQVYSLVDELVSRLLLSWFLDNLFLPRRNPYLLRLHPRICKVYVLPGPNGLVCLTNDKLLQHKHKDTKQYLLYVPTKDGHEKMFYTPEFHVSAAYS